jgi:hypothetical protein
MIYDFLIGMFGLVVCFLLLVGGIVYIANKGEK